MKYETAAQPKRSSLSKCPKESLKEGGTVPKSFCKPVQSTPMSKRLELYLFHFLFGRGCKGHLALPDRLLKYAATPFTPKKASVLKRGSTGEARTKVRQTLEWAVNMLNNLSVKPAPLDILLEPRNTPEMRQTTSGFFIKNQKRLIANTWNKRTHDDFTMSTTSNASEESHQFKRHSPFPNVGTFPSNLQFLKERLKQALARGQAREKLLRLENKKLRAENEALKRRLNESQKNATNVVIFCK